MSNPILDASTDVNAFGTPYYYLYDTNRDGTIPVTSASFTGYVGWVIRSSPTYYEDQEDVYRISLQNTSTIELGGLSAYVYNASYQYLGILSPSDGAWQFASGDYYLQFASATPINYSVSINALTANTPATFSNPSYSGTLVAGSTVTTSISYSDPDGNSDGIVFTGWFLDDGDLTNGIEQQLTAYTSLDGSIVLDAAWAGKTLYFTKGFEDDLGNLETSWDGTSTAGLYRVGEITAANSEPSGIVLIKGTATQGQVLTADTSALSDPDGLGTLSYQWKADGTDIVGATARTYTLTQAEVGKIITVAVSYIDGEDNLEGIISTATGAVLTSDPPGLDRDGPVVSHFAIVDNTLSASDQITIQYMADDPSGLGYLAVRFNHVDRGVGDDFWVEVRSHTLNEAGLYEATVPIVLGGSKPSGLYELTLISFQDNAVDGINTTEWNTFTPQSSFIDDLSVNNREVHVGVAVIDGAASEGEVLSVDLSGLSDPNSLGAFSYQWQRDGVDVAGGTSASYTLTQADVGAAMSVVVSYTDGQGTPESVASAQTGLVANVNDAPTGNVLITTNFGTPVSALDTIFEDQILTADAGSLADEDGLGLFSFQWQRDGVDIAGANGANYTLTQADVGSAMSVVVSYTDGQGTLETVVSTQTGPVENVNDAPTGGVVVTGNVYVTGTVTADTSTLADEDGLGPLSYQWYADGVAIANATTVSLTLTEAELGKTLTVDVSYTDGFGTNELVNSTATAPVTPPVSTITTAVTHRLGQAMADPEVSTTEIIGGNEIFLREVSSTDASTVFELVAAPTANISTLDFEFIDNVDLISFQLGQAIEGWTIQSNTAVANTITVSGFAALDGSQDIVAGVETVLATFETVASPDVDVTGIFTNGVAQQDISLRDVPATSKLANVTVHEVANGADAFVFADMAVDLASENAVGSFDALQALRLAVGLTKNDGTAEWHDYFAADINKDGQVTANDALNILKFAVGLEDGPAADWVFVDSTADYSPVTRQNSGYEEGVLLSDVITDTSVDFTAILVGDVDGSYIV